MLVTAATCAGLNSFVFSPEILFQISSELSAFHIFGYVRFIRNSKVFDIYLHSTFHHPAFPFENLAYAFKRASSILHN